jgi:hypothetical protein
MVTVKLLYSVSVWYYKIIKTGKGPQEALEAFGKFFQNFWD